MDEYLEFAVVNEAMKSPCQSKRGAVIWSTFDHRILATGFNRPPIGFACDGSNHCKSTCRASAVHAEQMAILQADHNLLRGASIMHVKAVDGEPVDSGGPSCTQCSKLILEAGIKVVYLRHDGKWVAYNADEFHRLSLLNGVSR